VNDAKQTLREVIEARFLELSDHLAALEVVTGRNVPGSLFHDYQVNQLRYEMASFFESCEELEERVVALERYQSFLRLAIRQVAVVVVSVSVAVLVIYYVFLK